MIARCLGLLVLTLLLVPPPTSADPPGDDFLAVFGGALAQAPDIVTSSEDLPAIRPPRRPASGEGQGGVHPLLHKGVLTALRKLADTIGLVAGLASIAIFMALTTVAFVSFTLYATVRRRDHLLELVQLTDDRPWKTLGLGLLNTLLAVVATAVLFRPRTGLLGILFLSWFVGILLEGLAARALRTGDRLFASDDPRPTRNAAVGALALWPLFFVPLYGQVAFVLFALRGLGAKVWLRFRPNSSVGADQVGS